MTFYNDDGNHKVDMGHCPLCALVFMVSCYLCDGSYVCCDVVDRLVRSDFRHMPQQREIEQKVECHTGTS